MNPTREELLDTAAEDLGRYEDFGGESHFEEQRQAIETARRAGITIGEIALRLREMQQQGGPC